MINGIFTKSIYNNIDNGRCIALYKITAADDNSTVGETVTCLGSFLPCLKDIDIEMEGEWVENKKYGKQFIVSSHKEIIKQTQSGIIAFLSSGLIKGIGEKTAQILYDKFKDSVFRVIEENPEKIASVKGVGEKRAKRIHESYMENKYAKEIVTLLAPYHISSKLAMKVYDTFGNASTDIIKNNPYELCKIRGIGFLKADEIAMAVGITKTSKDRIKACLFYVLEMYEQLGNSCVAKYELIKKTRSVLNSRDINEQLIFEQLLELLTKKKLVCKKILNNENVKEWIARPHLFKKECSMAQKIVKLSLKKEDIRYDVEKEIDLAEKKLGIVLDVTQREAVKNALIHNFMVITGGPGTGKTTVLNLFGYIYKKMNPDRSILYLSPTGKAARRLAETTGENAFTIHKALELRAEEMIEPKEVEDDVIVVDEASMIDIPITSILMHAINESKKVIFVGDVNQLPSVGPGLVLHDIIESGVCKVVRLNKVFRQDEDSNIYINTQKMQEDRVDFSFGKDFEHINASSFKEIEAAAIKTYLEKVEEYGLENIVYLTPFKEHEGGLYRMNETLQNLINPAGRLKGECIYKGTTFREGDIVMHTQKNMDEVSNGDVGIVMKAFKDHDGEPCVIVRYYGSSYVTYDADTIDLLTLAYALTVHKSQGSEYPCVITCLIKEHSVFLKRNMPYTAFSRGKKNVVFIGNMEALEKAVHNQEKEKRNTMTVYMLQYYKNMYTGNEVDMNVRTVSTASQYEQLKLAI